MKILFATTNPAKIKKYVKELEENNLEVLTIDNLGINMHVEESGKDTIENACIKAKAYYNATNIPSIAMDNGLYIEGIPNSKQPGTHVRRVDGKELTDDEMIEYYTKLVKQYGGKLTAKWVFAIAVYNGKEIKTYTYSKSDFYLIDKASSKRNPGYPLDSITIIPEYNQYLVELTKEQIKEKDNKKEVIEFIINSIK